MAWILVTSYSGSVSAPHDPTGTDTTDWSDIVGAQKGGSYSGSGTPRSGAIDTSGDVTFEWTFDGSPEDAPAHLWVDVTSSARVGVSTSVTDQSVAANVDNGLGDTDSGTLTFSGFGESSYLDVTRTDSRRLLVTAGVASLTISPSASADADDARAVYAYIEASAVLTIDPPDGADLVASLHGFTVASSGTALPPPRSPVAILAFSPSRRLRAISSDGKVNELEWNSADGAYIDGTLMDGGSAMPEGHWQSGRRYGLRRRLMHVQIEREAEVGTPTLTTTTERTSQAQTLARKQRWAKVPVSVIGQWHYLKVSVNEGDSGITNITLAETPVAQTRLR